MFSLLCSGFASCTIDGRGKSKKKKIKQSLNNLSMRIFTIEHQEFCYDSYEGHVIVANSAEEVREIAKNKAADEGKEVWERAEVIEYGDYTGHRIDPFILMSDFRAG